MFDPEHIGGQSGAFHAQSAAAMSGCRHGISLQVCYEKRSKCCTSGLAGAGLRWPKSAISCVTQAEKSCSPLAGIARAVLGKPGQTRIASPHSLMGLIRLLTDHVSAKNSPETPANAALSANVTRSTTVCTHKASLKSPLLRSSGAVMKVAAVLAAIALATAALPALEARAADTGGTHLPGAEGIGRPGEGKRRPRAYGGKTLATDRSPLTDQCSEMFWSTTSPGTSHEQP